MLSMGLQSPVTTQARSALQSLSSQSTSPSPSLSMLSLQSVSPVAQLGSVAQSGSVQSVKLSASSSMPLAQFDSGGRLH